VNAYYNEIDPYAAQWLRNLVAAGHIVPGDVDERSIREVHPADILGYTQCHFFAGIGVWSYALRQAGWPDNRFVWTGSCPCQPFSAAGKHAGVEDDRHLWPEFYRLIAALRPGTVLGEQVASKDSLAWLDFVCADLEAAGYAVGAVDTCAAGFGAPHIRQRLYFVADAAESRRGTRSLAERSEETYSERTATERGFTGDEAWGICAAGELADADGRDASAEGLQRSGEHGQQPQDGGAAGDMGDASEQGLQRRGLQSGTQSGEQVTRERNATNGFWRDADWLPCIDGKARPVEPGTFPLAHGATARVGRLRAYGNCIAAPQAAEIIKAYMSCCP